MELTKRAHSGVQVCAHIALMHPSHFTCCFGEQASRATHQPGRAMLRFKSTVWSPLLSHRDNWAHPQSSSHMVQSSQMGNSPPTSEFLLLYGKQRKQTRCSSLSGIGNTPADPVRSLGPVTANCKFPRTKTRIVAMAHNKRLSSHRPRIFCSRSVQRNSA